MAFRRSTLVERAWLVAVVFWMLVGCGQGHDPPPVPPPATTPAVTSLRQLEPGAYPSEALAEDEGRTYEIEVAAGDRLLADVMPESGDLDREVAWLDSAGQTLVLLDRATGHQGLRRIFFQATRTDRYRLRLSAAGGARSFSLTYDLRPAEAADSQRAAAWASYYAGEALRTADRERALEHYRLAAETWRGIDDPVGEAFALRRAGRMEWELGRLDEQIATLEDALARLDLAAEPRLAVDLREDLAYAQYSVGRWDLATPVYERALADARSIAYAYGEASLLNDWAAMLRNQGYVEAALGNYSEALTIWQRLGRQAEETKTMSNRGVVYIFLGDLRKAREDLSRAFELSEPGEAQRAVILTWIGWVDYLEGEHAQAIERYRVALSSLPAEDTYYEASIHDRLGTALRDSGQPRQALEHYQIALAGFEALSRVADAAHARTNLGETYLRLGDLEAASEHLESAIATFEDLQELSSEASTRRKSARAFHRGGDLVAAQRRFEEALDLFESVRARVHLGDRRSSLMALSPEFYLDYIDFLMQLENTAEEGLYASQALEIAERARARSLLELLHESRVDIRQRLDPRLRERERRLFAELSAELWRLTELSGRQAPSAEVAALRESVGQRVRAYEGVQEELRQASPAYAALDPPEPLEASQIRDLLDDDTAFLIYALDDEQSYLWWVERSSISGYLLAPRQQIDDQARLLYDWLRDSHRPGSDRAVATASRELSRLILEPIAERLANRRRLVVIADGMLQYLPFAVLPVPHEEDWLIDDHEIAYLPSASVLAELRRLAAQRSPAAKTIAVLADAVFSAADERVAAPSRLAAASEPDAKYPRLRASRAEAEAILAAVPPGQEAWMAVDFAVDRELVMSDALAQYQIIHFATHGILDEEKPDLSGLVLSLVDHDGNDQLGIVRLPEIYGLDLNADLVVLSGCETALGEDIRGEGLVSLTRGFMYAGATKVMVSLWSVGDRSTAELMKRFYHFLFEARLPPAAALRRAQRSMKSDEVWRAPYHWAGFIVVGDWRGAS